MLIKRVIKEMRADMVSGRHMNGCCRGCRKRKDMVAVLCAMIAAETGSSPGIMARQKFATSIIME